MKWIKDIFKRKFSHVCEFKYAGWAPHFGMLSELQSSIQNPSWYHFPSTDTMKQWMDDGFNHASTYQSHWKCDCGKHLTYFFLAIPCVYDIGPKGWNEVLRKDRTYDNLYQSEVTEMANTNPIAQASHRGKSMTEVTDELIEQLC